MADRRFLYVVDLGNGQFEVHEATDDDVPTGAIGKTLLPDPHQLLYTDGTRTIRPLAVQQNEILGRDGTANIDGLSTTKVRDLLNVDSGATYTIGSNLDTEDAAGGVVNLYSNRTDPNADGRSEQLNFKSLRSISTRTLKTTSSSSQAQLNALDSGYKFGIHGNARIAENTAYPGRKTHQRCRLESIHVINKFGGSYSAPGMGLVIFKNSQIVLDGSATIIIDARNASQGHPIFDENGNGNGFIDTSDVRFLGDDTQRTFNVGDWLGVYVGQKYTDMGSGSTSATIDYFEIFFEFAVI
jgi:hypothetical protein